MRSLAVKAAVVAMKRTLAGFGVAAAVGTPLDAKDALFRGQARVTRSLSTRAPTEAAAMPAKGGLSWPRSTLHAPM
jgi:hypothetical protein